ncbi:MAG TPA: GntR family transcriptional regulator [Candidatus Binataceae bacterium]|nr:GntR family transcriptional regulator [Candidatus Binataceae bacterium]
MPRSAIIPFRPPQRRRIHEDVGEQLRDAILDGRFPAGSKLPSERELAAEFQINRTSIREAIKVLESLGLLVVRQGDGATVQPVAEASLELLAPMIFHGGHLDRDAIADLYEVARPLCFELGRLAIERCRPQDLIELRRLRDLIADERLERDERYAAAHDLMVALADVTGNRVWRMLARKLRAMLSSEPMRNARTKLRDNPGYFVPLIEPSFFVPVLDECIGAVERGDREAAAAALRQFFEMIGKSSFEKSSGPARPDRTATSRDK